jgi:hypothetical protein
MGSGGIAPFFLNSALNWIGRFASHISSYTPLESAQVHTEYGAEYAAQAVPTFWRGHKNLTRP